MSTITAISNSRTTTAKNTTSSTAATESATASSSSALLSTATSESASATGSASSVSPSSSSSTRTPHSVCHYLEAEHRMRLLSTSSTSIATEPAAAHRRSQPPGGGLVSTIVAAMRDEQSYEYQYRNQVHPPPLTQFMASAAASRNASAPRSFRRSASAHNHHNRTRNGHNQLDFNRVPMPASLNDDEAEQHDDLATAIVQQMPALDAQQLGCDDSWRWSKADRSCEVLVSGSTGCTAFFHPNWSKGTAGVRGTKVLNNGRYYWEIQVTNRIFGTSMMFGIGTKAAALHANSFVNLLGADEHSWGLSHKGVIWHGGTGQRFTKCFKENLATTIGLLFDGVHGTLTYYKDGVCLGVAFRDLNKVQEPLYPMVSSTAAKTQMVLAETRRGFVNLQDRCRAEICKTVRTADDLRRMQEELCMPTSIVWYLSEAVAADNNQN